MSYDTQLSGAGPDACAFRMLTVIDAFARRCLAIHVERKHSF